MSDNNFASDAASILSHASEASLSASAPHSRAPPSPQQRQIRSRHASLSSRFFGFGGSTGGTSHSHSNSVGATQNSPTPTTPPANVTTYSASSPLPSSSRADSTVSNNAGESTPSVPPPKRSAPGTWSSVWNWRSKRTDDDETESVASHFNNSDSVQRKSSVMSFASTVSGTPGGPSIADSRPSSPSPGPRAPVVIQRTTVDDVASPAPSHFTAVAHAASRWVDAGSSSLQGLLLNPERVSTSIQEGASMLVASVADHQRNLIDTSRKVISTETISAPSLSPAVSEESPKRGQLASSPATTPKPREKSVSYISSTIGRAFGAFGSSAMTTTTDAIKSKSKKKGVEPNLTLPKLDKTHVFPSETQLASSSHHNQQTSHATTPVTPRPTTAAAVTSSATVELEDIVAPESKPPAFNVAPTKVGGEPLVDRFGFCLDARSGLGLLKEARRRQETTAKEEQPPMIETNGGGDTSGEASAAAQTAAESEAESGEQVDDAEGSTDVIITVSPEEEPEPVEGNGTVVDEGPELKDAEPPAPTPVAITSHKVSSTPLSRRSPQATPTTSLTVSAPEPDPASEESSPSSGSSPTENSNAAGPQSVKRLLAQLSDIDVSIEKAQLEAWDAFLKRRRTKLGLASDDDWSDNLIGVARMGTSGKAGRDDWKAFKKLVRGGVPPSHRPKVWAECSGATEIREPGVYGDLLSQHEGMQSLCLGQIDLE
jgi:hypothetical protein